MSDNYLNNIKNTSIRKERTSLLKSDIDDLIVNEDYDDISEISFSSVLNSPAPVFKLLPNIQDNFLQEESNESFSSDDEPENKNQENISENEDKITNLIKIKKEKFDSSENNNEILLSEEAIYIPKNLKAKRLSVEKIFTSQTDPSPKINQIIETTNQKINQIKSIKYKNFNFSLVLIIISIFVAVLFFFNSHELKKNDTLSSINHSNEYFQSNVDLNSYLGKLKKIYKSQSNLFWTNLESSFKHSVIDSRDPSIILIVHDQETGQLSKKIILDILNTFNNLQNVKPANSNLMIDPIQDSILANLIQQSKYDKTKLYIDNKLNSIFESGYKLAVVNNIELLQAYTMLLFYTYGDDFEHCKYPGIMILMTLEISNKLTFDQRSEFLNSSRSLTKYAEDYMYNLWSKYIDDDQLRPLFTRIANNVILLNNE